MSREIACEPLTQEAFAPFGDVLDCTGDPDRIINAGLCGRFHDRARIEMDGGRAGISLFRAEARSLPYRLDLLERHPLGSQAFVPMQAEPFLVTVAEAPDAVPRAFLTAPGQAINLHRGTWHGVLTPLSADTVFAVIDRVDPCDNLEEHPLAEPWIVTG